MEDIVISTPTVNSVIHCGKGAFGRFAPAVAQKKPFIITDGNVAKIYGGLIKETFGEAPLHVIPAGEASKNTARLIAILKDMVERGVTRSSTVVAFGGGVVGDIAGLAASLYMRGVNVVQIPTTLLAQVDSSVGGKTAVDMCGVKNVIGTFYQPSEVIVDPMFLQTLPKRGIRCGLGEIVKYGGIDGEIYSCLINNRNRLFDSGFWEAITAPCIRHKAKVVSGDERDLTGARKTLNLGHTTGHAFELCYKRKSHGEFVLIGIYYELYIAYRKGLCTEKYASDFRALIKKVIGSVPAYDDAEKAARIAKYDKKNSVQTTISVVAPAAVGKSVEIKLPADEYAALVAECARAIKEKKW